ncbi:MAG TPA: GRP family sugar transporter [Candidatus Eisenbacteria bacterium]|jgi:drug/metabolite transporter (DMT)-like permease|nr:GRP family sugar transporter [Candidatus Eisenbacteria bacterium]
MTASPQPRAANMQVDASRLRKLQFVGILSGFAAGAWLGAAEAPTKLVNLGISPVIISLLMVSGVFLARWTLPALIRGTAQMSVDTRQAPHLILWGVLAGCLWAVANTLTVFAIRDIGLIVAFPLWNLNSLLGMFWGWLLFRELRGAEKRRLWSVVGGAIVMFFGATMLAVASSAQSGGTAAARGIVAALAAGALWGTMYIPYRKAYLSGMNPLSFVAFFTVGELGMMLTLALVDTGSAGALIKELSKAGDVAFWLMLGGFVWVIGDLFQQYAAKYLGISRGIPLSNTNQLWGLLWGVFVFGELHAATAGHSAKIVGGSLLMAAGAGAIALASVTRSEHANWEEATQREIRKYGIGGEYARAAIAGESSEIHASRSWADWLLLAATSGAFLYLGAIARTPQIPFHWPALLLLSLASLLMLAVAAYSLFKTTRFN